MWVLLLVKQAASTTTCPGLTPCSGNGFCLPDHTCYCGIRWGLADCSIPLSALRHSSVTLALQWSGFAWYLMMLIVASRFVWNIAKVKGLRWILWAEVGTLRRMDPQQTTLMCCLLHCLFATMSYAIDPYYVNPSVFARVPATLFQCEIIALVSMLFFLVRFWIELQTQFSHGGPSKNALYLYDFVYVISLIGMVIGIILVAVTIDMPPTEMKAVSLMSATWPFVSAVYIGYMLYLLGCGLYYGYQMRQQLKCARDSLNEHSRATLTALSKITRLLSWLCVLTCLCILVFGISKILTTRTGREMVNSIHSFMSIYVSVHIAFGGFLVVVFSTLGQPDENNKRSYRTRAASHQSKKSRKTTSL